VDTEDGSGDDEEDDHEREYLMHININRELNGQGKEEEMVMVTYHDDGWWMGDDDDEKRGRLLPPSLCPSSPSLHQMTITGYYSRTTIPPHYPIVGASPSPPPPSYPMRRHFRSTWRWWHGLW